MPRQVHEVVGAREERRAGEAGDASDDEALDALVKTLRLGRHHQGAQRSDALLGCRPPLVGDVGDDGLVVLVHQHRNGHLLGDGAHEGLQRRVGRSPSDDLLLQHGPEGGTRDVREALDDALLQLAARLRAAQRQLDHKVRLRHDAARARVLRHDAVVHRQAAEEALHVHRLVARPLVDARGQLPSRQHLGHHADGEGLAEAPRP